MANKSQDIWSAATRRAWAERYAWRTGEIRRSDLARVFGSSPAQASADLQALQDQHPGCLTYDLRGKTYRWRAGRQPRLPIPAHIAEFSSMTNDQ